MNELQYKSRLYFSLRPYSTIKYLSKNNQIECVTDKRKMPKSVRQEARHIDSVRQSQSEVYRVWIDGKSVWVVYDSYSDKTRKISRLFGPCGERFGRMRQKD